MFSRLKKYGILHNKLNNKAKQGADEAFLQSCRIEVKFGEDCCANADVLYELLMSSNQINFTKLRPTKEKFNELINDSSINCGYIEVSDKFGEYGISGFYALKDGRLLHFAFSCNILGMGVEQFVYAELGYPKITVAEPVSSKLPSDTDKSPYWINRAQAGKQSENVTADNKVIMKGPCDLYQIFTFIKNSHTIDHEFIFVDAYGNEVAGYNHTASIVTALTASDDRKNEIIGEIPNMDKSFFDTKLKSTKYDFVFISTFLEFYSTVYQRKSTGERFALAWEKISMKDMYPYYDKIDNSTGELTIKNLEVIRAVLPETTNLVLILPPEEPFAKDTEKFYLKTRLFNKQIRAWAENYKSVYLIELSKYVQSEKDFTDGYFHYPKYIYYRMAQEIIRLLNKKYGEDFKPKGKFYLLLRTICSKVPMSLRKAIDKKAFLSKIVEFLQ